MYPQSREFRGKLPESRTEKMITAEFCLPNKLDGLTDGITLFPTCVKQHPTPPLTYSLSSHNIQTGNGFSFAFAPAVTKATVIYPKRKVEVPKQEPFLIRLDSGEGIWKFETDTAWFRNLCSHHHLINGSIHFRSKYHGTWEPFEFLTYFVVENSASGFNGKPTFVQSVFSSELLRKSQQMELLEMTFKLECIHVLHKDKEEIVLSKQRVDMNNALLQIPQDSDLCIKVDDDEFRVHMKYIKAFSAVSDIFSKYADKSIWDWSDIMTPNSMRALLRFIYYNEVDTINIPDVAFRLFQFGHMYQQAALLQVCENKLMSFSDDKYTLPDVLDTYMYFRITDEFHNLKTHFCGILWRNSKKYDTTKLKALAQTYESGLGVEALVEILQFEEPDTLAGTDNMETNISTFFNRPTKL